MYSISDFLISFFITILSYLLIPCIISFVLRTSKVWILRVIGFLNYFLVFCVWSYLHMFYYGDSPSLGASVIWSYVAYLIMKHFCYVSSSDSDSTSISGSTDNDNTIIKSNISPIKEKNKLPKFTNYNKIEFSKLKIYAIFSSVTCILLICLCISFYFKINNLHSEIDALSDKNSSLETQLEDFDRINGYYNDLVDTYEDLCSKYHTLENYYLYNEGYIISDNFSGDDLMNIYEITKPYR